MKYSIGIAAICLFLFQSMALRAQFGVNDSPRVLSSGSGSTSSFTMPDGSYVSVLHKKDGQTIWTWRRKCSCFPSGVCNACFGQGGKRVGTYSMGYFWSTCVTCGGTGRCKQCNGKGQFDWCFYINPQGPSYMVDPQTNMTTVIDPIGYGITSDIREREYNNYYSQSSNQGALCPLCKGDKNYTQKIYTSTSPYDKYCSECHETILAGTAAHFHQKCNACWGHGYIK